MPVLSLIFLGTGTSSSVPDAACLVNDRCKVCQQSMTPGSRNRRRNTSALLQIEDPSFGKKWALFTINWHNIF